MKILELFPTPILITHIPIELASIVPWFYKQEMLSAEVDSANYGERSKNSYILDEEPCNDLRGFILSSAQKFGEQLGYDYDSYKMSQSWISYKHPGQHHTMHTHPNSLISGVFYFGESEEGTPAIKFHNAVLGVNSPYISAKKIKDKRDKKYAWDYFAVDFEPGLLVIFPSYLHHSVPINNTSKTRCSLAFNIVPSKSLGDESSLTELKF